MVIELGEKKTEVARRLGISASLLDTWITNFAGRGTSKRKAVSGEPERIRALERELKTTLMERDILKKPWRSLAKKILEVSVRGKMPRLIPSQNNLPRARSVPQQFLPLVVRADFSS